MEKDNQWIVEHFSELVGQYPGKYIAVVDEQLVAVGDSKAEVEEKARGVESGKVPSVLSENSRRGGYSLSFIEFPYDCRSITTRIWRLESQPSCDTTSFHSYLFPDIEPLA